MLNDVEIANLVTIIGQQPKYEICKNHNLRIDFMGLKMTKQEIQELQRYAGNNNLFLQFDSNVLVVYR